MGFCKCCGAKLENAILEYKSMPNSAQGFLEYHMLNQEDGEDLKIFQCKYCKLTQLDCEPVSYYRNVIRATGFSDEMKSFRNDFFQSFVNQYHLQNKKILEIGCGKRRIYENV